MTLWDGVKCLTPGCRGPGLVLCDYPVKRKGRTVCCGRRVCRSCAKRFELDQRVVVRRVDYCPPHAKLHAAEQARLAEQRRNDEWWREFISGFTPVGQRAPEKDMGDR